MKKDKNIDEVIEDADEVENIPEENEDTDEVSVKELEDKIQELEAENTHLKDEYLRACADSENTKKRCAQEIDKNYKYAVSSFAKELLSVADNLHRALDAAKGETSEQFEQFRKGVELTESELMKVLNKFGISKMEPMGKVFDPAFHQVVQEVEDKTKPAGTVIAELQTGYMINDRLLREAMVVVSK